MTAYYAGLVEGKGQGLYKMIKAIYDVSLVEGKGQGCYKMILSNMMSVCYIFVTVAVIMNHMYDIDDARVMMFISGCYTFTHGIF